LIFKRKNSIFIILLFLVIGIIGWFIFNKKNNLKPITQKNIKLKRNIASTPKVIELKNNQNNIKEQKTIPNIAETHSPSLDTNEEFNQKNDLADQPENNIIEEEEASKDQVFEVSNEMLAAPTSNINESFNFYEYRKKYPIQLKWSEVNGADYYEIEIRKENQLKRTYFPADKNILHIMIYSNVKYQWRVLAYKDNKKLTNYSDKFNLTVNFEDSNNDIPDLPDDSGTPEDTEIIDYSVDVEEPNDQAEHYPKEATQRIPASIRGNKIPLWSRLWVNVGAGMSSNLNDQTLDDQLQFNYHSLALPSLSADVGLFITDNIALKGSYQKTTDTLEEINDILIDQDYELVDYSLEGVYTFGKGIKSKGANWYLKLGAKINAIPILEAYPVSKDVQLLSGNFLLGSLGLGRRTTHAKKWRSDFYINYLHPFSSKTNESDYSLNSSLMFESYLGVNYQLFDHIHLGLYWQGQFINLDYQLTDQIESVEAIQTFINNKLGLFLGLEF